MRNFLSKEAKNKYRFVVVSVVPIIIQSIII